MKANRLLDIFLFRIGGEEDSHTNQPQVTVGSIVWGAILRSSIIIVLTFLMFAYFDVYQYWWVSMFALWFLVAFPAWRQWETFHARMANFTESTLCGSCLHFESGSQLCKLLDEHVSIEHLPCEGLNWTPKSIDN
ncbi:MAG: hypothetical protein HW421_3559 [Ignavibacteria bacterium]|nr:hypothetical protein [Ignavibacteria bacterium]